MVSVNIFNRQRCTKLSPHAKELVKSACNAVLNEERFDQNCEIDVSFVSDRRIRELNKIYRNIDKSTDVLSFPLGEDGVFDKNPENGCYMLGDVIISVEHALNQAELYGHGINREIAFLTVHSVLHLLGYDHVNNEEERAIMRKKEEIILDSIGLSVNKE